MTEYTLTSPKWEGEIRLKFYDNGYLQSAEMPEVIDKKSAEYLASVFPCHEMVLDWFREHSKVTVTLIDMDTSFESFWDQYNKKRGSKDNAQLYWDGLKLTINRRPITLTDRQDIMRMIKRYVHRYQGEKKEFQPLATSFLHERQWVSELENTPRKSEFNLLSLINNPKQNG